MTHTSPRISPDGSLVAWSARRDRATEVYIAPVAGGVSTRLTFSLHPTYRRPVVEPADG